MLQLLVGTNIPLMKFRPYAYVFSGGLILATAIWLLAHGGPKLSVDFSGGSLMQISANQPLAADRLRAGLDAVGLRGAEIQQLAEGNGREYLIRLKSAPQGDIVKGVKGALQTAFPGVVLDSTRTRVETVGPRVGNELARKAFWAILGSLAGILIYVGIRYEFKYAVGAVVALFHDVFITLGVLCFTNREVSLTVVAALLTIAGYSVNDTIVVFDRIRERSKALRKEKHSRVMDIAVNETLSRTVITAFTVFLTAMALLIWGGEVLRDFSLAMVVGVAFGTYSSVYVASGLALDTWIWLDRRKGVQAE
ncbi:MAG: protein translocase subunit SecF [Candidatus Eisenbacteria bacterium]|uniref:Protein-export membrane protein SecF n=1 Tax=Eiseniibacteriota bacterium TaxID=2212470 RepID=A0A538U5B1_UNCEI|nr:MAG: protein translocase subunit SecF [Candidatus Eisenbacteria bacterium]